jgi:hypothetical protein
VCINSADRDTAIISCDGSGRIWLGLGEVNARILAFSHEQNGQSVRPGEPPKLEV